MTTRAVEQVEDWDSRAFSGGYSGLHDLAAENFSGIVAAGPTRLCMTNGTVVGVLDGTIEDFADASGTAYEAPSPALPLLAVMQARNDEVQGKYYTEDTSISEVDRTLSQGNFTGYVELSENVLSGDYYQVYHGGRSMSVAFVGADSELLTDDEAFEKADGEVGIYEVRPAEVDAIDIPEPSGESGGGSAAAATPDAATEAEGAATTAGEEPDAPDRDEGSPEGTEPGGQTSAGGDGAESAAADRSTDTATSESADTSAEPPGEAGRSETAEASGTGSRETEREAGADASAGRSGSDQSAAQSPSSGRRRTSETDRSEHEQSTGTASSSRSGGGSRSETRSGGSDAGAGGNGGSRSRSASPTGRGSQSGGARGRGGVADLETRSIPSLDPSRTSTPDDGRGSGGASAGSGSQQAPHQRQPAGARGQSGQSQGGQQAPPESERRAEPEPEPEPATDPEAVEELESELADREDEIERLESELADVEAEREDLRAERDDLEAELEDLRAERDELQADVERLEQRIDELRTAEGGESVADRERLSPDEAISQTNLFVRYGSKGGATLEKVHSGVDGAQQGAVNDNLELQHHTQFEADNAAVDGEPFEDYLLDTIQYRFVEWVVRELPYEIRDTGHEGALKDLYDALPKLDRAELNGTITVTYEEGGEEHRGQEAFDVVLRDRMGNPLAVANINESLDPATGEMMESLITSAQRVGEVKESLTGAFLVTSSFFEPAAMEAAEDATGGGLLSRDSRESFVKLSRKDGFHLCLVEARDENLNLSVPEI
ncbi:MAG: hypothetical protein ABEJ30_08660 [Halorientalis sp.]